MRVAIVAPRPVQHEATATTERLDRIATGLSERGHDVVVLCGQWWDGDRESFDVDGIEYVRLADHPDATEAATLRLPRKLYDVDPDVVHANYQPAGIVAAAKLGALATRAPLVVEWYGDVLRYDGLQWRLAARLPDHVITPSRMVRTHVLELGRSESDVDVIPNAIEMDLVRNTHVVDGGRDDETYDVVYSRTLDADANVESVLLALAEFRQRDWNAVIVGDGPEREQYEDQARDLRIEDRVEFVGDRPLEDRISTFKRSHIFVQTARRDPFATELLYALAAGCVGIVEYQTNSSAHELVEHVDRGFRVSDDRDVRDALLRAGDLSHETVNEAFASYDESAILDRYVERYERAIAERGLF